MSHENAKMFYDKSHEAHQKYEYFVTGAIGAMVAYTIQNYTPKKLGWSPSTLEPIAIICFAVAFYLCLRRLEYFYHILVLNSQQNQALSDADEMGKALRLHAEDPQGNKLRSGLSMESIAEDRDFHIRRSQSATPLLASIDKRVRAYYTWRGRLMIAGVVLFLAARILAPYHNNTNPPLRCAKILDQKTPESTHDSQQTKKAIHPRVQGPSH